MLHNRLGALHPLQWFFSRRYAMQIAQFMPQGATSVVLKGFFTAMNEG